MSAPLYISYNESLANAPQAIARLNQFLDNRLNEGAMAAAIDRMPHRQRR